MAAPGTFVGSDDRARCWWCAATPGYERYHDTEWGFPVDDDVRLFEKIVLEGFQSGLSWLTILNKRENFRRAFAGFAVERVARFDEKDVERLLGDKGIVRHRGKIEAAIHNAGRLLDLLEEKGSFASHVWSFEPSASVRPERLTREALMQMATTPASVAFSKDLKKRGWRFVGPTTAYAFMQAMGLVNDHVETCAFRSEAETARRRFERPGATG